MHADAVRHAPAETVRVDLLLAAAAAAPGPPGQTRWFLRPLEDGVEIRSTVKCWSADGDRAGRAMRIAAGAALRNIRVSFASQGRRATVGYPQHDGLLAVVRTGEPFRPSGLDLALDRLVSTGAAPRVPAAGASAARALLRRTADADRVWAHVLSGVSPAAAGTRTAGMPWPEEPWPERTRPELLALLGAPESDRIADLRVGQALQQARLLAAVLLGWRVSVMAGPVEPEWVRRHDPSAGRVPRATVLLGLAGRAGDDDGAGTD